ncbi:hypothetical protein [Methylomonas rosea]|uniref:DUF4145 domain-containing protein n=1 Tax=Methylomonas rosea TaxID=2952227 RepID=A0ABT1TXW6_9GAMM|nr:hypothetical protein [Methylomonas sp. WSC-7]MCQ8119617.1 hypothetical protein [Methylomonas sp. WSC-7]
MIKHLKKRFDELLTQANEVAATKQAKYSQHSGHYEQVDTDLLLGWCVKTRNLLASACGKESEHFKAFVKAEEPSFYEENPTRLSRLRAVFLAAKEDFEGGYLSSVRNLVQAEVFSTELEQARELLNAGYRIPAAVICGVVLETNLRSLCEAHSLSLGKLDKMNADLAKVGQYNSLVQKRITALAAIRNSAAHGNSAEFDDANVRSMIEEVEKLVADWLS